MAMLDGSTDRFGYAAVGSRFRAVRIVTIGNRFKVWAIGVE